MRILRGSVANLWNGTTWILAVLAATAILTLPASAAAPDKIYFIDIGKVHRANLDGSGVEAIVTGLTEPYGIDVDTSAGKIYWTDIAAKKIQRANLDGTGLEDLVTIGLSAPTFIALDTAAGKMYWTDRDAGKVQRANLDGSGVEDLLTGLSSPTGIDVDTSAGKIYWTDGFASLNGKIRRANPDGSGLEDLVTGLTEPAGITLDTAAGKMYWALGGKIQRANLDGSVVEDLITGLAFPSGVALDTTSGRIYWVDAATKKVQRRNLDGTGGVEDLITAGLTNSLNGIALGPASVAPPPPVPGTTGLGLIVLAALIVGSFALVRRRDRQHRSPA